MRLDVLYGSSDKFAEPLGVSICSLLENNTDIDISIYVIDGGITEDHISVLQNMVFHYKARITFIKNPCLDGESKFVHLGKYWGACWLELLPEWVEKVLYLDSDLVVLGSLLELAQLEMGDNLLAAVPTPAQSRMIRRLSLPSDTYCPNGGVMLMNVKEMVQGQYWLSVHSAISAFFTQNPTLSAKYVYTVTEGLFGLYARGRFIRLPAQYNIFVSPLLFRYNDARYSKAFFEYYEMDHNISPEEFSQALKNPIMVHFSTHFCGRPWETSCIHPLKSKYIQYREKTIFSADPLVPTRPRYMHRLFYRLFCLVPPTLACFLQYRLKPCMGIIRDTIQGERRV